MRDFKELNVWKKSHELCLLIYNKTNQFPDTEKFGIISQIRRASASVPTNISEVEYLLILPKDLNYLQEKEVLMAQVISIRKMLFNLIKAIV